MYLILLRRSKAFHWRQSRFEILQQQKLRGGVPPIPPGSITPPPPPPCTTVGVWICVYAQGIRSMWTKMTRPGTQDPARNMRFVGRRWLFEPFSSSEKRSLQRGKKLSVLCSPSVISVACRQHRIPEKILFLKNVLPRPRPSLHSFFGLFFFPVLFLRALPCCTSWTTGKGCRFAINRSSYITFNEWKQVDFKVTRETLNNFKVVWWTYFICRKDRM